MKNLLKNLLDAPAATFSAALVASLTYIISSDLDISKEWLVGLGATAALLSAFSGPNKP